jgi:hypothetical protein
MQIRIKKSLLTALIYNVAYVHVVFRVTKTLAIYIFNPNSPNLIIHFKTARIALVTDFSAHLWIFMPIF